MQHSTIRASLRRVHERPHDRSAPPGPGRRHVRRGPVRRRASVPACLVLLLVLSLSLSTVGAPARASEPAPGSGVWPLSPHPRVVAGFHPPTTRWGAGHRGVDLAGRPGQVVRAALAGRVVYAGVLAGRGVVVVDHGAVRATYEPVAATVHPGDRVAAGTTIGRLQILGSHCLPATCLHWGLIEGRDRYLDPLTLVGAAPVILLPLPRLPAPPAPVRARGASGPAVRPLVDVPAAGNRPAREPVPRVPVPLVPVVPLGQHGEHVAHDVPGGGGVRGAWRRSPM